MKYPSCCILVALILSTPVIGAAGTEAKPVMAEPFKIEASGQCVACHKLDTRLIGPSYKEISRVYNNASHYDPREEAKRLTTKLRMGGSMPPKVRMMPTLPGYNHPAAPQSVTDGDIRTLVDWIMGLKDH